MSNLEMIQEVRQSLGGLRQEDHKEKLDELWGIVQDEGLSHPYGGEARSVLRGNPLFDTGGEGTPATLNGEYLYHLTSISKVMKEKNSGWTFRPKGPHQSLRVYEYLVALYAALYQDKKDWIPLKEFADGPFTGERGITWWSNMDLLEANIIAGAHRLGLPNAWIPKYALVMRCPSMYIKSENLACVPTCLDGFTSEVFSPADYRTSPPDPTCGKTINLAGRGPLTEGVDEFVLRPIKAAYIEFIPVLIDKKAHKSHKVLRDGRLWQLLEEYYYTL
jgi:hypothetical protein